MAPHIENRVLGQYAQCENVIERIRRYLQAQSPSGMVGRRSLRSAKSPRGGGTLYLLYMKSVYFFCIVDKARVSRQAFGGIARRLLKAQSTAVSEQRLGQRLSNGVAVLMLSAVVGCRCVSSKV